MRPRLIAAENRHLVCVIPYFKLSFNEAAADCRGKLPCSVMTRRTHGSFKEAAADCRGKRPAP